MKKSILLSSLLATMSLAAGCTKSQTPDFKKDLDNKLAEINRQNEQRLADVNELINVATKLQTDGGQPGKIDLNGVIVIDTDKLDSRITVSLKAGLNRAGAATALSKESSTSQTVIADEQAEDLKADFQKLQEIRTYINLGCELAESEIAGLKDDTASITKTEASDSLKASRIFICGEHAFTKLITNIKASEIMLKDASVNVKKNMGSLKLEVGTLVLVGKNKISSIGTDDSGYISRAADLSISVVTEIYGDGELTIASSGGNNIASHAKNEK